MRTSVTRSLTFEAAHQLPWHPGKCRELHGHGYRLEAAGFDVTCIRLWEPADCMVEVRR